MEDCAETIIHPSNFDHYIARLKIEHYMARLKIEHYIAHLKIEHYKKLLETDIDETKRQIVLRLLAEEQLNLVGIVREGEKIRDKTEQDSDQKSAVNG